MTSDAARPLYFAAQLLIWETTQGERDADFNYVAPPAGYGQVLDCVRNSTLSDARKQAIMDEYNLLVSQVQAHMTIPSFTRASASNAPVFDISSSGGMLSITLTDTRGVLGNFDFAPDDPNNVTCTVNGDTLTVAANSAFTGDMGITVSSKDTKRSAVVCYGDGQGGVQDNIAVGEPIDDPVTAYFGLRVSTGNMKIVKSSEDGVIANVPFTVAGDDFNQTVYTTSTGTIELGNLVAGTYTVTEQAGSQYAPQASQQVTVIAGQTSTLTFSNVLKKFTITLTKRDSETGQAQGDATLAGAEYGIYQGATLVDTYFTGPDGSFTTKEYTCGDDWTIRELAPSPGYLLDSTIYPVGAQTGNFTVEHNVIAVNVTEDVIKARITLVKHTDDGQTQIEHPEVGAVFQMYLTSAGSFDAANPSERDTLTVDANGLAANTKDMPYGQYTIHQVSGWDGVETMPDFTVNLTQDGNMYTYILNNAPGSSLLRIEKRDAETGEIVQADGIGFEVYAPDGTQVVQHLNYPQPQDIRTFYTVDGWLMLPQPLAVGNGYKLVEVQTTAPYVLGDPVTFDVDSSQSVVTVVQYNTPQIGRIHIDKQGEVFASVTETGGLYQPVYETQGLAGAVVGVYAAADITVNGDVKAVKDTLVSTITTTKDGGDTGLLYPGLYYYVERTAPYGMVADGQKHYVGIAYAGQTVKETLTTTTLYDMRQKVQISFDKVMEQDETFHIGMNGEIAAVRMGLYAAEDIIAADGTMIPKDGLIEAVSVDAATGHGVFTADLPVGSEVYLKEIATDGHYLLSDRKFPLTFDYAGQDVPLVQLTANGGQPIRNALLRGSVQATKVDADYPNHKLSSAVFDVFMDANGNGIYDGGIDAYVGSLTETEMEVYQLDGLPCGGYFLHEKTAPAGYLPDDGYYYFSIQNDSETVTVENKAGAGFVNQILQTPPQTGDTSNAWIWLTVAGIAAALLTVTMVAGEKRKRKVR